MPHELLRELLPGAVGSGGAALLWLKGSWYRLLGMFLLGVASAYYIGTWLAEWAGVNDSATGLIVGLFSMAIVDRLFYSIEQFDFHALAMRVFDKFLGAKK